LDLLGENQIITDGKGVRGCEWQGASPFTSLKGGKLSMNSRLSGCEIGFLEKEMFNGKQM